MPLLRESVSVFNHRNTGGEEWTSSPSTGTRLSRPTDQPAVLETCGVGEATTTTGARTEWPRASQVTTAVPRLSVRTGSLCL